MLLARVLYRAHSDPVGHPAFLLSTCSFRLCSIVCLHVARPLMYECFAMCVLGFAACRSMLVQPSSVCASVRARPRSLLPGVPLWYTGQHERCRRNTLGSVQCVGVGRIRSFVTIVSFCPARGADDCAAATRVLGAVRARLVRYDVSASMCCNEDPYARVLLFAPCSVCGSVRCGAVGGDDAWPVARVRFTARDHALPHLLFGASSHVASHAWLSSGKAQRGTSTRCFFGAGMQLLCNRSTLWRWSL